jgi:hypothetical protein
LPQDFRAKQGPAMPIRNQGFGVHGNAAIAAPEAIPAALLPALLLGGLLLICP